MIDTGNQCQDNNKVFDFKPQKVQVTPIKDNWQHLSQAHQLWVSQSLSHCISLPSTLFPYIGEQISAIEPEDPSPRTHFFALSYVNGGRRSPAPQSMVLSEFGLPTTEKIRVVIDAPRS